MAVDLQQGAVQANISFAVECLVVRFFFSSSFLNRRIEENGSSCILNLSLQLQSKAASCALRRFCRIQQTPDKT